MDEKMDLTEKLVSREEKYSGKLISVHVDKVVQPTGRMTTREVTEHCPGVAIVALDDQNYVWTVTQHRYVFGRNLLEIPAGKLEKEEDPEVGALRELGEEVGAVPEKLISLGRILPSPGGFSEILYLYLAQGLHMGDNHPDEGELLIRERIPFQEMVDRIMSGEIEDAKTVAAILKTRLLLNL